MKWTAEAKVGLVTVIGVLAFTFVILNLAHAELFGKPGYTIHAVFQDANGLKTGNSVRYVGVQVGKVEGVTATKYGVDAKLKLDKGTEVPKDCSVAVTTDGLLGEKIVSITPNGDSSRLLGDGDYIYGNSGQSMDDMMHSATQLVNSVNDMMKNVNSVIGDEKTQTAMRGTIQNMEALTGNMNGVVEANSANLQAITSNMAAVTGSMNGVASQLERSAQTMDGDGSMSANIRSTAENMKNITDRFERIAKSIEHVTTDPKTNQDIQTTLHNTAQLSNKLNNILGGNSKIKVQGDVGMMYNDTKSKTSGSANFKVFRNDAYALLGADNIGDDTKMNLQYGHHGNLFDSRIGLIHSSFGAGLDFGVQRPFGLTLEGYDPNDWRYRITARLRIMPDMYLFGRFTRPMERDDGGNYYGVEYTF